MRILFDQGTPVPLLRWLGVHQVETAWQRGWAQLSNGDLLTAAEADGFDLLVTTDQNLRYQQNLSVRRIAIFVLTIANWPTLKPTRGSSPQPSPRCNPENTASGLRKSTLHAAHRNRSNSFGSLASSSSASIA